MQQLMVFTIDYIKHTTTHHVGVTTQAGVTRLKSSLAPGIELLVLSGQNLGIVYEEWSQTAKGGQDVWIE